VVCNPPPESRGTIQTCLPYIFQVDHPVESAMHSPAKRGDWSAGKRAQVQGAATRQRSSVGVGFEAGLGKQRAVGRKQ